MIQNPATTAPPQKIANALRYATMDKPQLSFRHVPTNAEKEPFKPLLSEKPHAIKNFEDTLQLTDSGDSLPQYITPPNISRECTARLLLYRYPHPYRIEIENYQFPPFVYTQAEPQPYLPFESTTATFVDTEEGLEEMLKELRKAKEIAIDLEHHDFRSYVGIVSLMQISTRDKDWIVDTLKPWRRQLQSLNQVFTDPNILKVFHGAHMDMIWLQRDLGLYVVGLFDTHYACRALGYSGGSLAFLLKKFVNFDAQKQYQTADWRIRPLPKEFFDYARSDTHFLLYIYDNMRNELVQKSDFSVPNNEQDKVHDVLVKSKEVALQTYRHPIYDAQRGLGSTGWFKLLQRTPALLNKQQFAVFRAVHEWRDRVAREQDDSLHFVMPNHVIFTLAREMPIEKATLFSLVQPLPQTMKLRQDELLSVISKAKEAGQDAPDMLQVMKEVDHHLKETLGDRYNPRTAAPAVQASSARVILSAPTAAPKQHQTSSNELRTTKSSFFGPILNAVFGAGAKRKMSTMSQPQISLQVPLPPLTAEIFAEPVTASTPVTPAQPTPAHTAPEADLDDNTNEIFTLKQKSRKRKSDVMDENDDLDLAGQADEVDISGNTMTGRQARKAAKKAKKQAPRSESSILAAEGMDVDIPTQEQAEEEEFDYATAPSVLNARAARAAEEAGRGRRNKKDKDDKKPRTKEPFNPFSKALDTKTGLTRAQKERAGKSMTFQK